MKGAVLISFNDPASYQYEWSNGNTTDSLTCFDGMDGYVNALVSGGVLPYSYHWENGSNTSEVFNLESGYNSVTVTDALGCTILDSIFIGSPLPLSIDTLITIASTSVSSDGNIEVLI